MPSIVEWNQRYTARAEDVPPICDVLLEHRHLLPATGKALDLACGRGGSALFLAKQGLTTYAWDYAETALLPLQQHANDLQLPLITECRDVIQQPPAAAQFDVIVVCHFLARELCSAIQQALRPGGLLFYQTFCQTRVTTQGPRRPAFRLADNELIHLFSELTIVFYREEGLLGDTRHGFRDRAQLIARAALK